MLFSKEFLDKIEYYTVSREDDNWNAGFYTKFVLHFKAWWRPRKVIKIHWVCVGYENPDISNWTESNDCQQLRLQLAKYFASKS